MLRLFFVAVVCRLVMDFDGLMDAHMRCSGVSEAWKFLMDSENSNFCISKVIPLCGN